MPASGASTDTDPETDVVAESGTEVESATEAEAGTESRRGDEAVVETDTVFQAEEKTPIEELSIEEMLGAEVVTATRSKQKATDAPATIYAFTEEVIERRGYQTLADLLLDVPGIEIQNNASPESRNHVTIRGVAGNTRFTILKDGHRISPPTNSPFPVGQNYPLIGAKRVEVVLGPASAVYGADAFSGVINIVTKTGEEMTEGRPVAANLSGAYGMYNTRQGELSVGFASEDIDIALNGRLYASDEPDYAEEFPNKFSWVDEQYRANGVMRRSIHSPNELVRVPFEEFAAPSGAGTVHGRMRVGDFELGGFFSREAHSSALGGSPEYHVYAEDNQYKTAQENIYVSHTYRPEDGSWHLRTAVTRGYSEVSPETQFQSTNTEYTRAFRYGWGRAYTFEEELGLSFDEWGSLLAGFSYEDAAGLAETAYLPFPYDPDQAADVQGHYYIGTDIPDAEGNPLLIFQDFYNVEQRNFGTYLQLQSTLWNMLHLTAGGRFDYNTRYGSSVNPRLGLVFGPSDKLRFKLLYGEAFLAPSIYETYRHYGSFEPVTNADGEVTGLVGRFFQLPNRTLQPQKLRSAEAGLSYLFGKMLGLSATGFYQRISDLIVSELTTNEEFKGVQILLAERPVNEGESTIYGGTGTLSSLFTFGPTSFNLWGSYTYVDGDIGGLPLVYTAPHTVKGGLDFTLSGFSLSSRAVYRSRSRHPLAAEAADEDAYISRPYTVVNAYASYRSRVDVLGVRPKLWANVTNLLNRRYANLSTTGEDGMPLVPQDPVRVLVGLTLDYQ